ncbi:MAG: hypothetical protein COA78_04795 [Blastopirellula sp.]|nr:MAG: hypothetical protein COA78_04795 [Blastopirellula sp.]
MPISFSFLFSCVYAPPVSAVEPTVAGLHELVVFDPGAHERGLPAVQFKGREIVIPPTVHVHRYYYSGDKEFQGPIINGGPTVVVAKHPKTGKQVYIDVVLPAGAPRIAHNKHGITYIYSDRRVEVKFPKFTSDPNKVVIKNHSGKGWGRSIHDAHKHVSEHVHKSMDNSQVVQSVKEVGKDTGEFLHGTKVAIGDLTTTSADGLKSLVNLIPGVVYLKSLSEEQPDRDYQAEIKSAARQKERELTDFVPTNR